MMRWWSRFANLRWTLPLVLLTYLFSVLTFPFFLLDIAPVFSRQDLGALVFAVCTLLSYGVPAACAAAWIGRARVPPRASPRTISRVTLVAVLAWLPHHLAISIWGMLGGIRTDGLIQ